MFTLYFRSRDRRELFNKAQAVFHEAQAEHELQEAKAERAKQQHELCNILYEKVL